MSSLTIKKLLDFFHLCEYLGSMLLVVAAISPVILFHDVLKSGIALVVLADAIAVGFILFAIIEIFPMLLALFQEVGRHKRAF